MTWTEPRSGACFNCGQPGHLAANCPATMPAAPAGPKTLSDDEIASRIMRFYQPASPSEMAGLILTWRKSYKPGTEYPEAPRYAPGFLALLDARGRERAAYAS